MKDTKSAAGAETLGVPELSASADFGSHQLGTLTRGDLFALRAELDWLDELGYPWGPFSSYQRHLEYILSQYDADPTTGAGTHRRAAHKDDKRGLIS